MKLKFGDRVEIQWFDIESTSAWTNIERAKKLKPKIYIDIGYYLNEDDRFLRVYNSIDGDKSQVGFTIFPKGTIQKIIKLRKV